MKRSHKFTVNLFALFLINFIFYQSTHYPRHILGGVAELSVLPMLFNLFFFFVNALFLIAIFERNETVFSARIFDFTDKARARQSAYKIAMLLVLQLICDVIVLQLDNLPILYRYSLVDILIVLQWIAIYLIVAPKSCRLCNNKRVLALSAATLILALLLSVAFNILKSREYDLLIEKYQESSPYLLQALKNIDFECNVKEFILDCIVAIALLVLRTVKVQAPKDKELSDDEWMKKRIARMKSLNRSYAQFLLTFILVFSCLILRAALLPYSTFFASSEVVSSSVNGATDLSYHYRVKRIYRGNDREPSKALYSIDSFEVSLEEKSEKFKFASSKPNGVLKDGKYNTSDCLKYEIDGLEVSVYGNYAILFFEGDSLEIVRIEELNTYEQKEVITQLLKELLSDGNVFAFEYGYQYLLRCEAEFIDSYIERYSDGNFTDDEIKWMGESDYRKEHIIGLACSAVY